MGPRRPAISTTGFPSPTPSDGLPDIGLPERLTNIFQGSPETSRFGVTPLSTGRSLALTAAPGGTLALGALRGRNILNIQDVQEALGLDEESLFNILNPFSGIARGESTASLGRGTFGQTTADVTLGGVTETGATALTPTEARRRVAAAQSIQRPSAIERENKQREAQRDRSVRESIERANRARGTGSRVGVAGR